MRTFTRYKAPATIVWPSASTPKYRLRTVLVHARSTGFNPAGMNRSARAFFLAWVCLHVVRASIDGCGESLPLVANTWSFTAATEAAWAAVNTASSKHPALDAVEQVGRLYTASPSPVLACGMQKSHFCNNCRREGRGARTISAMARWGLEAARMSLGRRHWMPSSWMETR